MCYCPVYCQVLPATQAEVRLEASSLMEVAPHSCCIHHCIPLFPTSFIYQNEFLLTYFLTVIFIIMSSESPLNSKVEVRILI